MKRTTGRLLRQATKLLPLFLLKKNFPNSGRPSKRKPPSVYCFNYSKLLTKVKEISQLSIDWWKQTQIDSTPLTDWWKPMQNDSTSIFSRDCQKLTSCLKLIKLNSTNTLLRCCDLGRLRCYLKCNQKRKKHSLLAL